MFNPSYIGERSDIEALIPPGTISVLDVGCSNGTLGESIRKNFGARVVGIELMPDMAAVAVEKLDAVYQGDAETLLRGTELGDERFELIILADVLEHVTDPWGVLKLAVHKLAPGGAVITSIPNVRHVDTLYNLVIKGEWPYRDRGIHDRTHLRFFARKNISDLMASAHLRIDRQETNYRLIERPHRWNRFAKHVAKLPGVKPFLAFQYITLARPIGS